MIMGATRAEKDLVAAHKEVLKRYKMFKCSCCRQPRFSQTDGPQVEVYRQKSKEAWATTYVICGECQRLPEKTILEKVRMSLVLDGQLLP